MYWAEEEAKYTSKYKSKQAGTHDAVWTAGVPHYVKWVQHRIKAQFLQPKQTKVPETASGRKLGWERIMQHFILFSFFFCIHILFRFQRGKVAKANN